MKRNYLAFENIFPRYILCAGSVQTKDDRAYCDFINNFTKHKFHGN